MYIWYNSSLVFTSLTKSPTMRQFLLFLLLISAFSLNATHNRAGEIVYKQTSDKTVEASIITYTQTSSIAADRDSLEICWGDNTCEFLIRVNGKGDEIENDYKVNHYSGSHTYSNHGNYTISMTDPNRNTDILNVGTSNSDLVQFHIQSTVNLEPMGDFATNQSPRLLEPPIDIGYIRQPFMHTPNATDLDGDSIAYELVSPLSTFDEPVPDYKMVDEIGANESNTYSFDESTGLFIWNSPQLVGQYNIAIKIKSYRNGVLQDMMVRDMQILIMPDENLPPVLEPDNLPVEMVITAGTSINWSFTVFDPEDGMNNPPTVTASSELLEQGASFMSTDNKGTFLWTASDQAIRSMPYQIVFKVTDSKGLATFKVVQVMVKPLNVSTSITFQEAGYQLFPNPISDQFYINIPTHLVNQPTIISIYDASGQLVKTKTYQQVDATIQWFIGDFSIGTYLVTLKRENAPIVSTVFLKI